MLATRLTENSYTVVHVHASNDADVKIVQTAVEYAKSKKVTVIGEDRDLLVLLCFHVDLKSYTIYFRTEPKQTTKRMRIWNIQKTKQDMHMGEQMCSLLPFNTTFRMFGIGMGAAYKKFKSSVYIQDLAQRIMTYSSKEDVVQAGEEIVACLYGGVENEGLDLLRYRKIASKVVTEHMYVQVQTLPPI